MCTLPWTVWPADHITAACRSLVSFITYYVAPLTHHPTGLWLGLVIGLGVLLLVRSAQVWRERHGLGYDTWQADKLQRRLLGWAGLTAAIATFLAVAVAIPSHITPLLYPQPTLLAAAGPTSTPLQPMELAIPALGLVTEIGQSPIIGGSWDVSMLDTQVGHLEGTPLPGEGGNAVLAGHVTLPGIESPGPFFELEAIQPGDRIFVQQGSQTLVYQVREVHHVAPDQIDVVYPTDEAQLTLITCAGWDGLEYTSRLVVIATVVP